MTQQTQPQADPAQMFESLRREVSLARAAVEGLTAAREKIPDYSETLGEIAATLRATAVAAQRIEKSPAVSLSPDRMARELVSASAAARAEDQRLIREAQNALAHSTGTIDGMIKRGQAADRQREEKVWIGLGGMLAGILLWAVLPGALARSLPESWHVPEWMAERTMRMDASEAGALSCELRN